MWRTSLGMSREILVVSDIHLGSPVLRVKELLDLLDQEWSQVVVNGDLLDSGKFHRYNKKHWKVLSKLRKLSKHIPVHLVIGNHDRHAEMLADILGLEYKKELVLTCGSKRILLVHGDQFDTFISKHPFITEVAAYVYFLLQRAGLSKSACRFVKERSKAWLDASEQVAKRALAHILDTDYTDILCGHTHHSHTTTLLNKTYWNSGTFCDDPAHYITVSEETGEMNIHEI